MDLTTPDILAPHLASELAMLEGKEALTSALSRVAAARKLLLVLEEDLIVRSWLANNTLETIGSCLNVTRQAAWLRIRKLEKNAGGSLRP